MNRWRENCKTY